MFGFFRRTKIESWEMELLKKTIRLLPLEFRKLEDQIEASLFKGVLIGFSDIPGYVAFSYNSKVLSRFDNIKEKDYRLTGITVFDKKSKQHRLYTIYVSSGTINGYSIQGEGKHDLDVERINVSKFRQIFRENEDFHKLAKILSSSERILLKEDEVYEVELNKKKYYHIWDIDDGDFIGIDINKNIYKITHDPFEIILVNKTLSEIFQGTF